MERFEHGGDIYRHPGVLDFSASLNPLGMPIAAREALVACVDRYASYPDPVCTELTYAIAAFEDVADSSVLACAGATDAFARLCAVIRPHKALVYTPCYLGYEQALAQVGAQVTYHDLSEVNGFDLEPSMAAAVTKGTDLVFIANPNNPTGRCVTRDVIVALLERALESGVIVVLDECFVDLAEQGRPSNDLLPAFPNLVIVKALTKTFALAGLRVGYALTADQSLLECLRGAGQPWAVSIPAQVAGVACLKDPATYLKQSLDLIANERTRLAMALREAGMVVVESEVNYLLWKARKDLTDAFLSHGVLVRSCANFRGLDQRWHRIAVRTATENDRLIAVLKEVAR